MKTNLSTFQQNPEPQFNSILHDTILGQLWRINQKLKFPKPPPSPKIPILLKAVPLDIICSIGAAQTANILQQQEMLRNQSRERVTRILVGSPEAHSYNQYMQSTIRPPASKDLAPLEKQRAFSHKKLTITTASHGHTPSQLAMRVQSPVFDVNKFYKNASKPMMQPRRPAPEDGKVSLKYGADSSTMMQSPQRSLEASQKQLPSALTSATTIPERESQLRQQMMELINSRLRGLQSEISSQSGTISELRHKIEHLEDQIRQRGQIIGQLLQQKNGTSRMEISKSAQQHNIEHILVGKLADAQRMLAAINNESNRAQNMINIRLDSLTKQIVDFRLGSVPNQEIKRVLLSVRDKMCAWVQAHEGKLRQLQARFSQENLSKVAQAVSLCWMLSQKLQAMEQKLKQVQQSPANTERSKQIQTKESIRYWESFQDFNTGQETINNNSIFAAEDYFFHPSLGESSVRLRGSHLSGKFTVATQSSDSSNGSQKIASLICLLKQNFRDSLPLKCSIDRHGRIVVSESGKLLQDQKSHSFFKLSQAEASLLQQRNYLELQPRI